uniref:Uncharacterized protein n=1 Tax=Rhizophora mucronata TaxID=61149 RepID=A0A2P2QBF6_RHIMU
MTDTSFINTAKTQASPWMDFSE